MDKVTIIIPTYNEAENIPELVRRLKASVDGVRILIVDDSPDYKTAKVASELGCQVYQRTQDKGLSKAVVDGIDFCGDSEKIVVMDADLQHPPEVLPRLIEALNKNDFVVCSRYVKNGGCTEWDLDRKVISKVANLVARPLQYEVRDLVSGFFGFKKEGLPNLSTVNTKGFKIMLELLVRGHWNSIAEIPYMFEPRTKGESKLSKQKITDYLVQLFWLYLYKWRWIKFGLVGAIGVFVYMPILYCLTEFTPLWYLPSAIIGIICASTSNYFLNHLWTFREHRAGHSHIRGWAKYQLMSGITDGMYIGLLALLVEIAGMWYMLAAGVAMVAVFIVKFKVASKWIWNKKRKMQSV